MQNLNYVYIYGSVIIRIPYILFFLLKPESEGCLNFLLLTSLKEMFAECLKHILNIFVEEGTCSRVNFRGVI